MARPQPREQIESVELVPFRAAVAAGARAVMTGHLLVPALDPTAWRPSAETSRPACCAGELGFTGVTVTDAWRCGRSPARWAWSRVSSLRWPPAPTRSTPARDHADLVEEIPGAVEHALQRRSGERVPAGRGRSTHRQPCESGRSVRHGGPAARRRRCATLPGGSRDAARARPPARARVAHAGRDGVGRAAVDAGRTGPGRARRPHRRTTTSPCRSSRGRSLVLVIRDPLRHPWQHRLLDLAAARPGAWSWTWGGRRSWTADVPLIRTRGIAPGLLAAAAELLAGRVRGAA